MSLQLLGRTRKGLASNHRRDISWEPLQSHVLARTPITFNASVCCHLSGWLSCICALPILPSFSSSRATSLLCFQDTKSSCYVDPILDCHTCSRPLSKACSSSQAYIDLHLTMAGSWHRDNNSDKSSFPATTWPYTPSQNQRVSQQIASPHRMPEQFLPGGIQPRSHRYEVKSQELGNENTILSTINPQNIQRATPNQQFAEVESQELDNKDTKLSANILQYLQRSTPIKLSSRLGEVKSQELGNEETIQCSSPNELRSQLGMSESQELDNKSIRLATPNPQHTHCSTSIELRPQLGVSESHNESIRLATPIPQSSIIDNPRRSSDQIESQESDGDCIRLAPSNSRRYPVQIESQMSDNKRTSEPIQPPLKGLPDVTSFDRMVSSYALFSKTVTLLPC